MDISLEQSLDAELIRSIVTIDEIFKVAYPHDKPGDFYPEVSGRSGWFVVTTNSELAGIIHCVQETSATVCIHPYLLESKRRYCRDMMREFYLWFLDTPEEFNKIVAYIPECYEKTINFAHKVGFIDEGYRKAAYNKDNTFIGVCHLGITKKEIEEYLNV